MIPSTAMVVPMLLLATGVLVLPDRVAVTRRLHTLRFRSDDGQVESSSRGKQGADPLASASIFDLLAACVRAGLPLAGAARAVAPEAPEPLGEALRRAADLLALGADPAVAWDHAAQEGAGGSGPAEITSLTRIARRSARSGASLAVAIGELAEQQRAAVEDLAAARSERATVMIGGPLGLCFLPAFVCLGIVPVVIGLAGRVLSGDLL